MLITIFIYFSGKKQTQANCQKKCFQLKEYDKNSPIFLLSDSVVSPCLSKIW